MIINHLPKNGFAFGNNTHFAYNLSSGQILFIHTSLQWLVSGGEGNQLATLTSKIQAEDIRYLQDVFDDVVAGNFTGKVTVKILGPEGLRWLLVVPFLVQDRNDQLILATVVDITDEVLSTQAVTKYADKKNSILHMLGHDLRGPLNIGKSLLQTISRQIKDVTLLEKTKLISTILQQSVDMINDLLNREFMETANVVLAKKRVNIVGQLRDYMEESKRSEVISGITFQMTTSSPHIYVDMDDAKFMQVINNLMSNALKFTPVGGSIYVTVEELEDRVNFKFSDTGIGIPAALLPEIFKQFSAARRPGLQGEPTLGIGLSIVKTIIEWHGGTISCQSEEGVGTTFFISLPKNTL
ncbi:Sensor histidine kinase of a two component response regulator [Pedobacter sp. BAL39]|uniref:sensor histidine kinase n=1 Tax=Pedobacter sp. BAL39 TaxID=391596 RepID=UPI0001559D23|nr:HAMP domain-containing sensor histidine kinase [Pedobacter sp. BAL39]EDM35934.1 Sensor histidine kinase of a two component response regulator [Pedobacter sp. BAL39]